MLKFLKKISIVALLSLMMVQTVSAARTFSLPEETGHSGQFLSTDGENSFWDTPPSSGGGAVSSVFGRTGAIVAVSGDYTTSLVPEGTNQYWTNGRFDARFGIKTTDNLTEGATNLYNQTHTGDVTGATALTIANLAVTTAKINTSAVTNAKLADMAQATFKGRQAAGGTGAPEDLTATQAKTILNLTGTNSGDVTLAGETYLTLASQQITANPISLAGSQVSGTLAAARFPSLTGDVTNSAGSLTVTIPIDTVTFAKMQNISSGVLLGRASGGSGNTEEITLGAGLSFSGGALVASGAVTSVSNSDGTMVISPTTGAVVASVDQTFDFDFSGAVTFTGTAVDFTNLPTSSDTPTISNELTTKAYVDAALSGLDPSLKLSLCQLATTGNITLSGEQTIDGTLTSASRVLVWMQSTASQNGIYVTGAGAWTRATDYDTAAEVLEGTNTFVTNGTLNGGYLFVMIAPDVTTLGTDTITFTKSGATTTYTASLGVQLVGNDFRANLSASGGLALSGNTIVANVDNSSLEINSNQIRIKSPVSLANGGFGIALSDPNADRVPFWDDSAGNFAWLTVGSGLSITGTTISATTGSGHTIKNEGSGLTQRTYLDFIGSGIAATDNSGGDSTEITLHQHLNDIASIDTASDFGFLYASSTDAQILTRTLAGSSSVSVSSPELGNVTIDLTGVVSYVNSAGGGFGFLTYNGSGAMNYRQMVAGSGISITNPLGTAGSPTFTNTGVLSLSSSNSIYINGSAPQSNITGNISLEVNTATNYTWTGQHQFNGGLYILDPGLTFFVSDGTTSKLFMEPDQNVGLPTSILYRSDNFTNFVEFKAATGMTTDITYIFPQVDAAGFWYSDGAGNLSIQSALSGSGTDNNIVRWDGTGAIQDSSVSIGDNGNITSTIANNANVVGLTLVQNDTTNNPKLVSLTNAGTNNALYIDANGDTGFNSGTSGALLIDNSSNLGIGLQVYSSNTSSVRPLVLLQTSDTGYNKEILRIIQAGTSGSAANIRMDGPSPQIEWVETDQVAPYGKFETQVQGDIFYINGRNSADSSFENSVWFYRPDTVNNLNGNVGIGADPYNIEKLTIGNTTGGVPRIALGETTSPTSDSGYGKLYFKSSDSQPYFMDDSGNERNLYIYERWLAPFHGGFAPASTSQTFTAGRVLMAEFSVPQTRTVDRICYIVGATSNGNVTVGIYGPVTTTETSTGVTLLVQSSSTAQGTANSSQCITVSDTVITAGTYYVALEGSSATGTYMRQTNQEQIVGWGAFYNRGGGYGTLTTPAPTTTDTSSAIPSMKIRLK